MTNKRFVEFPPQNLQAAKRSKNQKLNLASDIFLSMATVPLLTGLLASKALGEFLKMVGSESEEIFRGDRLPVLHFPHKE